MTPWAPVIDVAEGILTLVVLMAAVLAFTPLLLFGTIYLYDKIRRKDEE
jgi:cytochrome bd-type quinol oxidase subunit 2